MGVEKAAVVSMARGTEGSKVFGCFPSRNTLAFIRSSEATAMGRKGKWEE